MKLLAQILLFCASLVALAVLYIFLLNWELIPGNWIDQTKVALVIIAPFIGSLFVKRRHYAVAALVAFTSLSIVSWELSMFMDRL